MLTAQIKQQVQDRIKECQALLKARYGVDIKMPVISYNLSGTTAGTANFRNWVIRINPVLLVENLEDMLYETVPHELAHLATYQLYPEALRRTWGQKSRPHGTEWKSIMRAMNVVPSRCHQYDVTNASTRKSTTVLYKCVLCKKEYGLGPKRVANLTRNPHAYTCRCRKGAQLVPADSAVIPAPIVKAKPITKPTFVFKPSVGTKMELCADIYRKMRGQSRGDIIAAFMSKAGCTKAGASTYHATLKSKFG